MKTLDISQKDCVIMSLYVDHVEATSLFSSFTILCVFFRDLYLFITNFTNIQLQNKKIPSLSRSFTNLSF